MNAFHRSFRRMGIGVLVLALVCGMGTFAWAKSVRWDQQSDWSKGKASNVTWSKTPGQLEIVYDPNKIVETPFIYLPSSQLNTVTKMDTRNGQILWTFNLAPLKLGSNPSRTTVDSQGNVWVGLRNGSYVVAISAAGKFLAGVNVGSGPRSVTIDKNGDIWAGGYNAASIVKISKATFKPILTVKHRQICTYGATTDSDGNIWTMNRCKGHVAKISPSGQVLKFVSTPGGYGIAADRIGNVWVASWEQSKAYRINAKTYQVTSYPLGAKGRGVGIDAQNRAWVACSHDNNTKTTRYLARIDPSNGKVTVFRNVGTHTIGVAIDSKGFVWANSYNEGLAYKLRVSDGTKVAAYPICDTTGLRPCANTGCKPCKSPSDSGPYTYSDMTGFSIQTRPNSGTWRVVYDATCRASFNKVSWSASLPKGTRVRVRARSATSQSGLAGASWGSYVGSGQSPNVAANRWIELEFSLESDDARYTPVVNDATLDFAHFAEVCDGVDNDCDGQVDENWSDLGNPCKVGVGACENSGKMVCNSAKNGTTCSAKAGTPSQEVCDGKDNDCNGKVDENFPDLGQTCHVGLGICRQSGKRVCASNQTSTTCSAQPGQPQQEVCDGLDNNCDGQTDEKWPNKGQSCTVGVGGCQNTGTWICQADKLGVVCSVPPKAPQPEICDGVDNDCNGKVDDGLIRGCQTKCGTGTQRCQAGKWAACSAPTPQTESCNDRDDDCNGQVDDNLVRACSTSCGKGKETCVRGKWVFCDAPQPVSEDCDGKDNDCNGKVDDGLQPRRCLGDCGEGTATCTNGKWGGCSGPSPEAERCDGKDNDCNGKIDDKLEKPCRTSCGEGRQICRAGQWTTCNAPPPGKEICDNKDNDCDGRIDNGTALCPGAMTCQNGACQQRCRGGECPRGMRCVHNVCVSEGDPCESIKCQGDKTCVNGICIDPCYLVSCPTEQVCQGGRCVENNCYSKGCPNAQRCVNGVCEPDPCTGVSCSPAQFCRNGKCVDSCAGVSCGAGETCRDGKCSKTPPDPCDTKSCAAGETCEKGSCVPDPCDGISCPKGRRCVQGNCQHDPCFNIFCPDGQKCANEQCMGDPSHPNKEKPDTTKEKPATGEKPTGAEPNPTTDAGAGTDAAIAEPSPDHTNTGQGDDNPGVADRSSGKPSSTPDVSGPRYQPGQCGCEQDAGPFPLLLWMGLLLLGVYFRRLRFKRFK